ncbi:MAG: M56 family metallopeptidase [Actinomycetota bacterium]
MGAVAVFVLAVPLLAKATAVPPRWRVRLAAMVVFGMFVSSVSLLAAVLLPEVLVVNSLREIWETCTAAFQAIWGSPLGRWPSVVAGIALALVLGRFFWALVGSLRATRRARVLGEPRRRLAHGERVYVLPVDIPEAYSVPGLRGQVVVTRGLLDALDEEERHAVLLHEEGHLRSRHHLLLSFARAARTSLSPLPTGRAIAGLEQAIEEAADEYAAARLGNPLPVATGLSKAALAGMSSPVGVLSLGSGQDVPARVRRLLEAPSLPRWVPVACLVALAALLGVIAVTQMIAGFAVVAAAHHLLGVGAAATCPLIR